MKAVQAFEFPTELANLVAKIKYRPGWVFRLGDVVRDRDPKTGEALSQGLTLVITILAHNAHRQDQGPTYRANHYFPVPPINYNRESWQWWLFEMCKRADDHEAMEFFEIDGEHPYAPNHGQGWDPFLVTVVAPEVEKRTTSFGEVVPA